jgi:hypothetical protein
MSVIYFSSSSVTGVSNLCRSTIKMRPFSLYSHASYSPAHKNLRMLDRTCEGMSVRFPICKKYDCETENIFETNAHKIDASWKIINADKKPTTIDDQQNAIKRIDDNQKNQLCTFLDERACELCTEGTRAVRFKYISTTCQNNLYVNDSMSRPPCAIFYIALSYLEVYFM